MRLADFLDTDAEAILTDWVAFARTQPGAEGMNLVALRDHAAEMLSVIAMDLRTSQTAEQQQVKSHGHTIQLAGRADTAAESHGAGRADSGFSVAEMLAEFRALRASVVRLWTAANGTLGGTDLDDLTRFNEAVDQALAESISRFHTSVTQSQDLLVAVLGHDLRTPLHTVTVVTEFIADSQQLNAESTQLMGRAIRSAKRMARMLDDLLDFTRSRTGSGIPVTPYNTDLHRIVEQAVDEFRSSSPQHHFVVALHGDLHGVWDGARIGQVLSNLLGNAVQHGAPAAPVQVSARGEATEVVIEVRNTGRAISANDLPTLFSPFKRLRNGPTGTPQMQHLGLGLYIADQIVSAHGGRIVVTSTDAAGTCIAAHLPRRRPSSHDSLDDRALAITSVP